MSVNLRSGERRCVLQHVSDGPGRVRRLRHVVEMRTQSDKQIKEHRPTLLHLHLHRAAALERPARSYNQCQEMCPQPTVRVGSVRVGIPHAAKNRTDIDSRLQALLAKSEALQVWDVVADCGAVYGCIAENGLAGNCMVDGSGGAAGTVCVLLEGRAQYVLDPALDECTTRFALQHTRGVVTAVEVLENARECFGIFVVQVDALGVDREEELPNRLLEKR